MGILDHLWDDTMAGPVPKGLGKLRRCDSIPIAGSHPISSSYNHGVPISRSITILKNNNPNSRNFSTDSGSSTPTGSSTPGSPASPVTPRVNRKRLMRAKSTSEALERSQPRSPTVYDWVVISAIDR